MSEFSADVKVYDVINELRRVCNLSIRQLAALASISPTTLTSMLDRRPEKISIRTLDAIGQVFDLAWMDLYNCYEGHCPDVDTAGKVSSALYPGDFESIMARLAEMPIVAKRITRSLNTRRPVQSADNGTDEFRRSIHFVLERLNNDGLVEAMRRILELENDERYYKKNNNNTEV